MVHFAPEDHNGSLDVAEFSEAVLFLGGKQTLEELHAAFCATAGSEGGSLTLDQFKEAWCDVADVLAELEARGLDPVQPCGKPANQSRNREMLRRAMEKQCRDAQQARASTSSNCCAPHLPVSLLHSTADRLSRMPTSRRWRCGGMCVCRQTKQSEQRKSSNSAGAGRR